MRGVVAAGHPLTAEAGARVLRAGGNAVDAAIGAMVTSWVAEPLLTGPGAGGYMLVAAPGQEPVLLDFFVEVPGRGADPARREPLEPVDVSFGDAMQVFNIGAASVGVHGTPAGICEAASRFGTVPLAELTAPAAELARRGVDLTPMQAYVFEILAPILQSTPEAQALFCREGGVLKPGERFRDPELADTIERLGAEGAAPFYSGEIGAAARTGCSSAAACSRARTSRRTGRSRASRCASATTTARCSPTRRRTPAASCSPTRSRCSSAGRPAGRRPAR